MKERLTQTMQQAGQMAGEAARWAGPALGDALTREAGMDVYGPDGGPELTQGQQFGSEVAQFAMRRGAERLREGANARSADQPRVSGETGRSPFAVAKDRAAEFISWLKPAAADALNQGTGLDAYDLLGGEQPELSRDQQFASTALRFAADRVAERAAARQ